MNDNKHRHLRVREFLDSSRLDDLVAVTIEHFLIEWEDDEEPLNAWCALIELAAAPIALIERVNAHLGEALFPDPLDPDENIALVQRRSWAFLREFIESSEAAPQRPLPAFYPQRAHVRANLSHRRLTTDNMNDHQNERVVSDNEHRRLRIGEFLDSS
jgi:hypothetical protein